jgi:hypothetical protein
MATVPLMSRSVSMKIGDFFTGIVGAKHPREE